MYYSYRVVDGYNCPIVVVLSRRGLGKTFNVVKRCLRRFVDCQKRFVYVVETKEMIKTLSQNRGEKFFAGIEEALRNDTSKRSKRLYEAVFENGNTEVEEGEVDLYTNESKIEGGTIRIAGNTAGYIVALSDFANLKRNNFADIETIFFDEFISEHFDVRTLNNAYKLVSLIQSIARLKDVKIYMAGNTIRLNDIILHRLKCDNMKPGEIRVIKDEYGLLVVCHYVDNNQYKEFCEASDKSVAGRLARLMNETSLDDNKFKVTCPPHLLIPSKPKQSSMLLCLHGEPGSVRINITKDYSELYVFDDYGRNTRRRYCFEQKYISDVVRFDITYKELLLKRYEKGCIKFDTPTTFIMFKTILKLDTNS